MAALYIRTRSEIPACWTATIVCRLIAHHRGRPLDRSAAAADAAAAYFRSRLFLVTLEAAP
jgi:hypothetical protein